MELIFNPCGEFRWSPEGPVSHSLSSPPRWCPRDLFRTFNVCSDAKERVECGKQQEATAPIQSLVKLQPWFLSLRWKTCLRQNCSLAYSEWPALGQNTHDDDSAEQVAIRLNIHSYDYVWKKANWPSHLSPANLGMNSPHRRITSRDQNHMTSETRNI